MSNPYGGGYPSYQPGPNPFEPGPYGPYGPVAPTRPRYDGLSVAALVCSLTCCAAPVGIGLSIAGLVRTKHGRRSGRWAAVTGLIVGILGTLALAGMTVGLVWVGTHMVTESSAKAGQCVDLTTFSGEIDLWKTDCDGPHDAEIALTGVFVTAEQADAYGNGRATFCTERLRDTDQDGYLTSGEYVVRGSTDALSESDPSVGDAFVCFLARTDGAQLRERLLGGQGDQRVAANTRS